MLCEKRVAICVWGNVVCLGGLWGFGFFFTDYCKVDPPPNRSAAVQVL